MKKQPIIIATIFVAGLLFFSQTACAATLMDRQQTQRIKHGITSGQITPREAKTLYQDQRQVRQLRRRFLADGSLSHRERSILAKRMERTSDRIYRFKHNSRRITPPQYRERIFHYFVWR
jgi:hypothetical protein